MNISEKFKMNIRGHRDIDFIDIDEVEDTELYLDPYVIQALRDKFSAEAHRSIKSFFVEVFSACQSRDMRRLNELLRHASEPNETNLGMKTISKFGKGSTSSVLSRKFFGFYRMVKSNPDYQEDPLMLCMYIKRFDKDCMSDLITNIIRNLLYEFTLQQCKKWNIPLSTNIVSIGYYWDYKTLCWKELYGQALYVNTRKKILLVPKHIVRKRYVLNVECYIRQYILKDLQNWHLDNDTDMCIRREDKNGNIKILPPKIQDLYDQEVVGTEHKDYAYAYSITDNCSERNFLKDITYRIRKGYGVVDDNHLDYIVYKQDKSITA